MYSWLLPSDRCNEFAKGPSDSIEGGLAGLFPLALGLGLALALVCREVRGSASGFGCGFSVPG